MVNNKPKSPKPAKIQELLAKSIKEARGRLNLTQEGLAERTGLTTSFIGEVEICRKFPRPKTLQKISDALGLKPYELFLESSAKELVRHRLFSKILVESKAKIGKELEDTLLRYSRR